jgi:plastocyanin
MAFAFAVPAVLVVGAAETPAVRTTAEGASTGRLRGVVRLTVGGTTASGATAYGRRSIGPRMRALPETSNVVVSFFNLPGGPRTTAARAKIRQQGEQFVPHVLAIEAGTPVDFPNEDPYFHNVFSLSRPGTFDLGRFPSGNSRSRVFDKPGIIKVYCHLHSQMSALIRVFDHSWFSIPDSRGEFAINDVPAGVHTLVVWHERIGERREEVTIRAGEVTEVAFTLPVLESSE